MNECLLSAWALMAGQRLWRAGGCGAAPLVLPARHLHAAPHLLRLPALLAQRLRRDATIWRQDVLPGAAWTHWEQWLGSLTKSPGKRVAGVGVTFQWFWSAIRPQGEGMMSFLSAAGLTALVWVRCQDLVSEWLVGEED